MKLEISYIIVLKLLLLFSHRAVGDEESEKMMLGGWVDDVETSESEELYEPAISDEFFDELRLERMNNDFISPPLDNEVERNAVAEWEERCVVLGELFVDIALQYKNCGFMMGLDFIKTMLLRMVSLEKYSERMRTEERKCLTAFRHHIEDVVTHDLSKFSIPNTETKPVYTAIEAIREQWNSDLSIKDAEALYRTSLEDVLPATCNDTFPMMKAFRNNLIGIQTNLAKPIRIGQEKLPIKYTSHMDKFQKITLASKLTSILNRMRTHLREEITKLIVNLESTSNAIGEMKLAAKSALRGQKSMSEEIISEILNSARQVILKNCRTNSMLDCFQLNEFSEQIFHLSIDKVQSNSFLDDHLSLMKKSFHEECKSLGKNCWKSGVKQMIIDRLFILIELRIENSVSEDQVVAMINTLGKDFDDLILIQLTEKINNIAKLIVSIVKFTRIHPPSTFKL
ncbi:DgyrCDS9539 [Dimorphilus gyrociliatus]|uniref:DgyrCDS9539 n=1 Tax=Dimorphilus gyrociliatus TaxID=2664684 RepID=A0A7I8W2K9_9ANNE|nr:DgyrCDS9539 [Dimorphilus gyrociliatus]